MKASPSAAARDSAFVAGAFAMAMLVPQVMRADPPHPLQMVASLVIAALAVSYGKLLGRVIQLPARGGARTPSEVVAGFAGVSLVHLLATTALALSAAGALAIDVGVAVVLTISVTAFGRLPKGTGSDLGELLVDRPASQKAAGGRRDEAAAEVPGRFSAAALDAILIVGVAALAGCWAREAITAVGNAEHTGVFSAWHDFFLHAAEITYLRDYPVFDRNSLYLAGSPQPFYHRASYAMPALYSAISGSPSLETATAFWMPLGLTLCGMAVYGFGSALGGRAAALAAVGALFLLPDASMYGLRNGYFSFHWLMQVGAGAGYAIAITVVALTVLVSDASGRPGPLLGSVLLAASAAVFRMQVAVPGTAVVAVLALIAWRPARAWGKPAAVCLAALAILAASFALEQITLAPHFLTGRSQPLAFFEFAHRWGPDRGALYAGLVNGGGAVWSGAVGYALTLIACLGALLPAAVVVMLPGGPLSPGWRFRALPIVLLAAYLGLILVMPTPAHGDYTEYSHGALVLVYALLAAAVGSAIGGRVWRSFGGAARGRHILSIAAVIAAAWGGSVPVIYGRDIQQRWLSGFSSIPIAADLFKAAGYVRRHSTPGEIVLSSREDPLAIFVALSERPAFVSRADLYQRLGGDAGHLAAARSGQHARLADFSRFEQLREFGRQHRIAWYILEPGAMPSWPLPLKDRCSYCGPDIRVFDLR